MDELLSRLDALEREVQALRDRQALYGLLSEYEHLATSGQSLRIFEQLWASGEDVTMEWGPSGVYRGRMSVTFFYDKDPQPGRFAAWSLSTPYLTLDGDRAAGVCTATVMETDAGDLGPRPPKDLAERRLMSDTLDAAQFRAEWLRARMEFSFRREADGWRICALRVGELLRAPNRGDWVTFSQTRVPTDGLRTDALFLPSHIPPMPQNPPEFHASRASSRFWQYTPAALPPDVPEILA